MISSQAFRLIQAEREKQDAEHGVQNHSAAEWITIMGMQFGDACRWAAKGSLPEIYRELVQICAVGVAAMESLARQEEIPDTIIIEDRPPHIEYVDENERG